MRRKTKLQMEEEITKKMSLLHKFICNVCTKTEMFTPTSLNACNKIN